MAALLRLDWQVCQKKKSKEKKKKDWVHYCIWPAEDMLSSDWEKGTYSFM